MIKRQPKVKETKQGRGQLITALLLLQGLFLILLLLPSPQEVIAQAYYSNVTILTRLNVSNAAPIVSNVVIFDNDSLVGGGNILLTPGTTDRIYCNATINDSNGWGDINLTNGTLFLNGNWTDGNDRNTRYQNASCSVIQNNGFSTSALATCSFEVYFFANNGSWNCSVHTRDNSSVEAEAFADSAKTIESLYALDLDTDTLDYGLLNVTAISGLRSVNVTNAGNMDINLSVEGYGSSLHDDLSMNCSQSSTINISQQRYSINPNVNWSTNMTYLTSDPITSGIENLTILQRTSETINVTNSTYWAIQVPIGVESGICNGSLVFSAIPT